MMEKDEEIIQRIMQQEREWIQSLYSKKENSN